MQMGAGRVQQNVEIACPVQALMPACGEVGRTTETLDAVRGETMRSEPADHRAHAARYRVFGVVDEVPRLAQSVGGRIVCGDIIIWNRPAAVRNPGAPFKMDRLEGDA